MEDKESCQNDGYVDRKSVPTKMQLFSTWEVRKIPANCVSRCNDTYLFMVGFNKNSCTAGSVQWWLLVWRF